MEAFPKIANGLYDLAMTVARLAPVPAELVGEPNEKYSGVLIVSIGRAIGV
jgi:hypothetical protein